MSEDDQLIDTNGAETVSSARRGLATNARNVLVGRMKRVDSRDGTFGFGTSAEQAFLVLFHGLVAIVHL